MFMMVYLHFQKIKEQIEEEKSTFKKKTNEIQQTLNNSKDYFQVKKQKSFQ